MAGRPRIELGSAPSDGAVFIRYTTRPLGERKASAVVRELFARAQQRSVAEPSNEWNSRRESNPDLFVRTEASSCVRPREPENWKGCRELNSDLKVRSLAPSIRWTTSPFIGRRCRTRTDIQSLEDSVLIPLNEAPSCKNWCGMQESNLLRLA